jgi:DNA-binding NarL/FixJ family response regulator
VGDRFTPSGRLDVPPASAAGRRLRVVVADDNYLVREALAHLLDTDPRVELAAVCEDALQLAETVERELPDVVVTDIRMPPLGDDDGVVFANGLRATHPGMGVVVVSQYADPRYGLALLEHGSERRAYLLKDRLREREPLIAAIYAVAAGGSMLDPNVVDALIAARRDGLDELTSRELEILSHIAQGQSNQAIAEQLYLTKKAVEKHINAIFMKLGLSHAEDVSRRVKATLIYLARDAHPGMRVG